MPFAFELPSTAALSLSAYLTSGTHPSLLQTATTNRNVLRNVLKSHKRLDSRTKASNLTTVQAALNEYLAYLFLIDAGLSGRATGLEDVEISLQKEVEVQWRSTLASTFPGREARRWKGKGLDCEVVFSLTTLAYTHSLLARNSLLTIYSATTPPPEERTKVIQSATKALLTSSSIHDHLLSRAIETDASSGIPETLSQTQAALKSLALAEATLLAVLKDDPHPFVVAQLRNKNDKDWMIKAPEIPKVRAHLFARLCLAAAEHAGTAEAGLSATGRLDSDLTSYVADLRKTARAKACRLFGIDAELEGETGKALAWLQAAKKELKFWDEKDSGRSALSSFKKLRKDLAEKKEDKKVERGGEWGSDAGRLEELRIVEYLEAKWRKMNDTINTQLIPPFEPLVANMPSGRDVHSVPPFARPSLDEESLTRMRAPAERSLVQAEGEGFDSSEDEGEAKPDLSAVPGSYPGTAGSQNAEPYY